MGCLFTFSEEFAAVVVFACYVFKASFYEFVEYIVYHEITHSIERKHNQNFWNIINKKFPDYQTKEKDLLTLVHNPKNHKQPNKQQKFSKKSK